MFYLYAIWYFHERFSWISNPCSILFLALTIKLVNSFILVWHSDYELSSKTYKPFFIIKESSKCHNINYRAKNHVELFCLVCNRSRASSTRTRPTSTHIGWRVKENFPETFTSQLEKNENVIHRPRSVHIRRNCTLCLSTGYSRPRAQFLPIRTSHSKL